MAEMSDTPSPMDELVDSIRADIRVYRAQVDKDGAVVDGKPHPLLAAIAQANALLAKIFKDMN